MLHTSFDKVYDLNKSTLKQWRPLGTWTLIIAEFVGDKGLKTLQSCFPGYLTGWLTTWTLTDHSGYQVQYSWQNCYSAYVKQWCLAGMIIIIKYKF